MYPIKNSCYFLKMSRVYNNNLWGLFKNTQDKWIIELWSDQKSVDANEKAAKMITTSIFYPTKTLSTTKIYLFEILFSN